MSLLASVLMSVAIVAIAFISGLGFMYACLKAAGKIK